MTLFIILGIIAFIGIAVTIFFNTPRFGRQPSGERLERIKSSPNWRDGQFRNVESTVAITSDKGFMGSLIDFLFKKHDNVRPAHLIQAVKTDLKALPADRDWIVWFGHSSYLLHIDGRNILVDPVFYDASPVPFVNRPFKGTDIYTPEDMPDIDYLVISHDHWDHLDYRTVTALRSRIGKVICPLGVGEHFERWDFPASKLVELDWNESADLADGMKVNCLTARHFSGRGMRSNQTLWASYVIEAPSGNIFIGGDSGYGRHFKEIGNKFSPLRLAIIENGQYDKDWRYIHTMPEQLADVMRDLAADRYITVHHSKYALAKHPWDEPLKNETEAAANAPADLTVLQIGLPVLLSSHHLESSENDRMTSPLE